MRRSRDFALWAFVAVAAALLPVMVLASFDFGVTWDEKARHRYGELVWEFLTGSRQRSSFAETGGHLYGGLFDVICAGLEQWLPGNRYVIRPRQRDIRLDRRAVRRAVARGCLARGRRACHGPPRVVAAVLRRLDEQTEGSSFATMTLGVVLFLDISPTGRTLESHGDQIAVALGLA